MRNCIAKSYRNKFIWNNQWDVLRNAMKWKYASSTNLLGNGTRNFMMLCYDDHFISIKWSRQDIIFLSSSRWYFSGSNSIDILLKQKRFLRYFHTKDLGEADIILGFRNIRDLRNGMSGLSQSHYIGRF